MNKAQILILARQLENADRFSNAERTALLHDIERYARHDLYGAARLCKDHLNPNADLRLPTVVMAANRIGKHFEMRTQEPRRPVELYGERDCHIRQPEDGRNYRGPVIGATPHCVIQRDLDTGDYIVHARASLVHSLEAGDTDKNLSINYPFKAVGGVGLVSEAEKASEKSHETQYAHTNERAGHHNSMEIS